MSDRSTHSSAIPRAAPAADDARTAATLASHRAILVLCVVVLTLAVALQNDSQGEGIVLPLSGGHTTPSVCLMRLTFHVPCPGCGLTRSFVAIGSGDLAGAVRLHALGPALFVLVAAQIPYRLWLLRRRRAAPTGLLDVLRRAVCPLAAAALLLNWIVTLLRLYAQGLQ